jgi:branched-chain amino acid transport system permease protein
MEIEALKGRATSAEVTNLPLPGGWLVALLAKRRIWASSLAICALAAAAWYVDSYLAYVATSWVIFGLLGLSLDLVWGRAGILSLGQTAFYGIGGYLGSIAAINLAPLTGNTLVWSLPSGALAGACGAALIGWLIFFSRMGALQVTILTYTVTLVIWTIAVSFHATVGDAVIGGDNGLAEIPSYILGFADAAQPLAPNGMLGCTILIVGGAYLLSVALMRSPFGLLVDCVRLNAEKTELLGYDTRKIQFLVFVLAGGIAGIAGALFGHWANYLTPSVFSVQEGLLVPIYVLVGGRGTLAGPFVGALLVGGLSFWLGGGVIGGQTTLIMGLSLIVLVLFVDGGVIGAARNLFAKGTRLRPSGVEVDSESRPSPVADLGASMKHAAGASLETRAIVKRFGGITPVKSVSLSFRPGRVYCLIGPNGAGKSALLRCCMGSHALSQGEIMLAGERVTAWKTFERARAGLGVKMQTPQVFDELSVAQNLWVAAYRAERDRHKADRRVADVLGNLGLASKSQHLAGDLSHGERQWLDIGMVLGQSPAVIMLDEPAAGMTEAERDKLAGMIRDLAVSAVVIVVEHDMDFVRALDAEVIVLHQGEVFERGSIEDLRRNEAVLDVYLGRRRHVRNS